jgi:CheY-like chemotaxis protein/PAS domain-containing protein
MNSLSIFRLIAATLELSVPVYGFLLIRRFGARSVRRFLILAACALALLHLVQWLKSNTIGLPTSDLIFAFASGLLLIGMGHLQGLNTQRKQSEFEEQKLSANWQLNLKEKTADLAGTNQQLLAQVARYRDNEQILRQSEQQYRFIFTESPQPQWIFDLRSLRLLAVNRAALNLFGFSLEEFMAMSAGRLLQPEAVRSFLGDVARPCPKAQSRGRWLFCAKSGGAIEVDISGVDLNYDGCPARLLAVIPVIERLCPQPEQPPIQTVSEAPKVQRVTEPPKSRIVTEAPCNTAPTVDRTTPIIQSQPKLVVPKSPEPLPGPEPKTTAPAASRPVAPTSEPISLAVRHSTPAKPLDSTPQRSESSRSAPAKKPDLTLPQAAPTAPKSPPLRSASGKETILLVEPEVKARGLARFILSRQGYRVIETDCSSTVLALWESESSSIDVLLTDVALPEGISGTDLAAQLRQTRPELKVVYTAAPSETETEEALLEQNIVPKPYSADKLLDAVKNCLTKQTAVSAPQLVPA